MQVAQKRIDRNAWKREAWKRCGASRPVFFETCAPTYRTARAVPLQIKRPWAQALRSPTADQFVDVNKLVDLLRNFRNHGKRKGASPPVRHANKNRTACAVPLESKLHWAQALRFPTADHFADVGKMVDLNRGIRPESLPPAEDVKKLERRLASDEKKVLQDPDKLEGA